MFKGSIVLKRTTLLNMIQNAKLMFRSDVSPASKNNVWGQQLAYEWILEGDLSEYDWDPTLTSIWININPRSCYEGFDWLFRNTNGSETE